MLSPPPLLHSLSTPAEASQETNRQTREEGAARSIQSHTRRQLLRRALSSLAIYNHVPPTVQLGRESTGEEPTPNSTSRSGRPLTIEELEYERAGGFTRKRSMRAVQQWRRLVWCGCVLPQALVLLAVPTMACLPHHKTGVPYFLTINFMWVISFFVGIFLSAQLLACYLRCGMISLTFLNLGPAEMRWGPGGPALPKEALEGALADAQAPSLMERLLAAELVVLVLEILAIWAAGLIHVQGDFGAVSTYGWVQFILCALFLCFVVVMYPYVFRALRIGILRREKCRVMEYITDRIYTFMAPTLVLQGYLCAYGAIVIGLLLQPVNVHLLHYSTKTGRSELCADLGQEYANCTSIFDVSLASSAVVFTAHRPDAVRCPTENGG